MYLRVQGCKHDRQPSRTRCFRSNGYLSRYLPPPYCGEDHRNEKEWRVVSLKLFPLLSTEIYHRFKYPLAVTSKLIDVFGDHQCIGYDVSCAFSATIRDSTLLSQRAIKHQLQLVVDAFHGYSHNRLCQLRYHPLYRLGLGLEDLESCERVFSGSNSVSRVIRHASYFHWHQFLDLHFQQWNEDRLLDSST